MVKRLILVILSVVTLAGCPWSVRVSLTQSPPVYFERSQESQGCGTFMVDTMTPVIATNCPWPADYLKAHEEAHGIILAIGNFLNDGDGRAEKAADVLAFIRTGYVGPYWPNGIPADAINAGRSALETADIQP